MYNSPTSLPRAAQLESVTSDEDDLENDLLPMAPHMKSWAAYSMSFSHGFLPKKDYLSEPLPRCWQPLEVLYVLPNREL
jgi:hypothetical protein